MSRGGPTYVGGRPGGGYNDDSVYYQNTPYSSNYNTAGGPGPDQMPTDEEGRGIFGTAWDFLKENPELVMALINAGVAGYGAHKGGQAADRSAALAEQAMAFNMMRYNEAAPLRDFATQHVMNAPDTRPDLGSTFEDTSNPFFKPLAPLPPPAARPDPMPEGTPFPGVDALPDIPDLADRPGGVDWAPTGYIGTAQEIVRRQNNPAPPAPAAPQGPSALGQTMAERYGHLMPGRMRARRV